MPIARMSLAVISLVVLALAACGGNDDTSATSGTPVLRNSPIPTIVLTPTAAPMCEQPAASSMPATFPADVSVPPGFKVDVVETAPHLKVQGRVVPPGDGRAAYGTVFDALLDNMSELNWTLARDGEGDGAKATFTAADGRSGTYHALPILGCPQEVQLTYELLWVTP